MKKIVVVIIFLGCHFYSLQAQAVNACPKKIGYLANSPCNHLPDPDFYLEFELDYNGSLTIVDADLGSNAPACKSFTITAWPNICNRYYDVHPISHCKVANPTGFLEFDDGKKCYYKSGALIPCGDVVVQCLDGLKEFAKDFLKVPGKDCKQWEGPCNSESEIFRIGFVGIGTTKTDGLQEGQLLVKGGIVTERLQICKPAWCDYVFSDTFKLRSLPQVEAYIKKHKHLPGSTPQADINNKGGLSLDIETVNQQEKIEEAYLHLIALNKRMDRLQQKMPTWIFQNTHVHQENPNIKDQLSHITAVQQLPALSNIILNCAQLVPASTNTAADGIGGVKVTGIPVPFSMTWTGPVNGNMLIEAECGGFIRLVDLKIGTYTVTVEQPGTSNIGTCQLVIDKVARRDCASLLVDPCKTEISNLFKSTFSEEKPDCKQWEGDICSTSSNIYRLGNVCIGGSTGKSGYSLAVQGGILCDQFRVELCNDKWCDYVFDDNYPLPSLSEVQQYISTHRHLPGIVSQAEVSDKGGFEIRSVKLDQQEKIEEAYLYLLQLDARAKQLRTQLNQQ